MSMSCCERIICIVKVSTGRVFRNAKTIRLNTIVATITPDTHTISVRISCGLPSIETLGTVKERHKNWSMLSPLTRRINYSYPLRTSTNWIKLIVIGISRLLCLITGSNLISLTYAWTSFLRRNFLYQSKCALNERQSHLWFRFELIKQSKMVVYFRIVLFSLLILIVQLNLCHCRSELININE